jgi:hypothetical protein
MLRSVRGFKGSTIHALDGDLGHVEQVLFDDEAWTVRYLVVDTGGWLQRRRALISPIALGDADWERRHLHVRHTLQDIERSPLAEDDFPIGRGYERAFLGYYGWPVYWGGAGLWGAGMYPGLLWGAVPYTTGVLAPGAEEPAKSTETLPDDPHLRSAEEVTGYRLAAVDGEIGYVDDFLFCDETWAIRYLGVDTGEWWPGKKVLIPPAWIQEITWTDHRACVDLTRAQVESSPAWDPYHPVTPEMEAELFAHYGRELRWDAPPGQRRAA